MLALHLIIVFVIAAADEVQTVGVTGVEKAASEDFYESRQAGDE